MTPWAGKGERAAIVAKRRIEKIPVGAVFVMKLLCLYLALLFAPDYGPEGLTTFRSRVKVWAR